MSFEIPGYKLTRIAGGALSQFRFVEINSDGNAVQTDAATDVAVGVVQSATDVDKSAEIMVTGVSKVTAGGAVTRGGLVTSDASGRAVNAATGNIAHGQALEGATAAGQIIAVLLFTPGRTAAP